MVRPCRVGEDRTTLLTGSVGVCHVHAVSRYMYNLAASLLRTGF